MSATPLAGSGAPDPSQGMLLLDADSYIAQIIAVEQAVAREDVVAILHARDAETLEMLHRYYLLVRSTFAVVKGDRDDAWLQERSEKTRRWAYYHAACFTAFQRMQERVVAPEWIEMFDTDVRDAVLPRFPGAADVTIASTLEPGFRARARPGQRISISILTREILRTIDLMIWNLLSEFERVAASMGEEETVRLFYSLAPQLARGVVPYLIFLNEHVDLARLPVVEPVSIDVFHRMLATSELQTKFVMAHEYGHLALGHLDAPEVDTRTRSMRELDADGFARETLTHPVMRQTRGEVNIALNWLFRLQLLEEVVAKLLRGERLRLSEFDAVGRIDHLAYAIEGSVPDDPIDPIDPADGANAATGSEWLTAVANLLIAKGSSWLQGVADILVRPGDDLPAPRWWEDLLP